MRMALSGSSAQLLIIVASVLLFGDCKRFERCELARELLKQKIPRNDLAAYVCIAEGESSYNTAAINVHNTDGSSDHGLFQINDRYWCEAPNSSNGCKVRCDKLRDDDISDDVKCALLIQRVHGLNAWVAYNNKCAGQDLSHFTADCQLYF